MSNRSILMKAEPLRLLDAASIGANYAAVGNACEFPSHIIHIQNNTNQDVYISFDGVTNHEFLPTGAFLLLDISANKTRSEGFFFPVGLTVYAKQSLAVPTLGAVFVSSYYGSDNNF